MLKKKPMTTVKAAHNEHGDFTGSENWITAVSALHHTDLLASGNFVFHLFMYHKVFIFIFTFFYYNYAKVLIFFINASFRVSQ